jgi:hypothetical protein
MDGITRRLGNSATFLHEENAEAVMELFKRTIKPVAKNLTYSIVDAYTFVEKLDASYKSRINQNRRII